jgi:hypothetical protein
MMRLIELVLFPRRVRERRRIDRERRRSDGDLRAYEAQISTIMRPPEFGRSVRGRTRTSAPVAERAAELLTKLEHDYADFRRAAAGIERQRHQIREYLRDPDIPPVVADPARERFSTLEARHPTTDVVASREADWQRRLSQVARWVRREPPALAGSHGAVRDHDAEVIFDRGDRLHAGWWHGP